LIYNSKISYHEFLIFLLKIYPTDKITNIENKDYIDITSKKLFIIFAKTLTVITEYIKF